MGTVKLKVAAFEDGSFQVERKGLTFLLGVLTEGFRLVNVSISLVKVDGLDATGKLITLAEAWRENISLIMLSSIAYAGFNVVDPEEVYLQLKRPVIVVLPRRPKRKAVERALKRHFRDWEKRLEILAKVGEPLRLRLPGGQAYVSAFGMRLNEALRVVQELTVFGGRPEPLRMANLLVRGLGLWRRLKTFKV